MPSPKEFTISSGALCFGSVQELLHAASIPVQPPAEPNSPPLDPHDTFMKRQEVELNVPAQNGTWTAFPLVTVKEPHIIKAWFAAHSDVDPWEEVQKILRVAGNPFEAQTGNYYNCDNTRAENIMLVNNLDWDRQGKDEEPEFASSPINVVQKREGRNYWANRWSIGIIDYAHAAEVAQSWKGVPSSRRQRSEHGFWLHSPKNEDRWVRLGFDDNYQRARSLLFFSQRSNFYGITLPTPPLRRLRTRESQHEEYYRRYSEGYDYTGLEWLYNHTPTVEEYERAKPLYRGLPMPHEHLMRGPYEKELYLFSLDDLDAIRAAVPPPRTAELALGINVPVTHPSEEPAHEQAIFAREFRDHIWELLNEMILSYVECVAPTIRAATSEAALGEDLFPASCHTPNRGEFVPPMSATFSRHYREPPNELVDAEAIQKKIWAFIQQYPGNDAWQDPDAIQVNLVGLVNAFIGMVNIVVEIASERAVGRSSDVPNDEPCLLTGYHIRRAIFTSQDVMIMTVRSAVFWMGAAAEARARA